MKEKILSQYIKILMASLVKVLEKAGLISRGREAQWRPCRIEADALKEAADWIGDYRKFWEESFDRLDAYLKTLVVKKKGKKSGKKQAK